MTLADRARQAADAAPRHQSAEVLRECAAELDHLSQRADHLGTSAHEWYGMWNIANERANKAEADLAALRAVVRGLPCYPELHPHLHRAWSQEANAALAAAKKMAGGE